MIEVGVVFFCFVFLIVNSNVHYLFLGSAIFLIIPDHFSPIILLFSYEEEQA